MIFGRKIDDNSHGARGGLGQLWVDQMNLLVLVNSGMLNKNLGVIERLFRSEEGQIGYFDLVLTNFLVG